MTTEETDGNDSEDIKYYGRTPDEEEQQEKLGCLDAVAASAGIGCALAIRAVIIIAALVILFLVLHFVGFGNGGSQHRAHVTPTPRVLGQRLNGLTLVLLYLLHLQKELGGRVVDELH